MMHSFFNDIDVSDGQRLDKRQFNQIKQYHFKLRRRTSDDRINHYLSLRRGLDSTENGTRAHGIYVALINDLINRYDDVANYHRAQVLALESSSVAAPAA